MHQSRRSWVKKLLAITAGIGFFKGNAIAGTGGSEALHSTTTLTGNGIRLGAFSMSLNVKDLAVSRQFYENLGFAVFGGSMQQHYLIMKNEQALVGLFQGMFKKNILTFNPGWDYNAKAVEGFDDVRIIQNVLKSKGIKLDSEADVSTQGPASILLSDPDGNLILLDQHL